ncbi:TlpA disulfide reductase family protein [Neopusillimonas aromaticivorans]|jgi:peroxiredoxin|uniref:TlpA disulfide reductase family protein n=1 Tax=Neopusillimonas aromaticivorans TaxID=2979868 RepID=UPI0025941DAC|nr:TlpA disulfide reductase family protein [Neopusillimonas aromaticivorans]NLZ11152.1 TlpA family protein disulfide reductase [Alcaligenaceae bacterium]WJJ92760.1 TlpA disulfide reductase family protein [Neopusillimonas aromaticivorans]
MSKLKLIVIAAVVAVGLLAWQLGSPSRSAPNVSFTSLQDKTFSTADLENKVVLVKFWTTDCVTCIKQMPDMTETYKALASQGYEVIAVALQRDNIDFVRNFTQTRELPFTVVYDADGSIAKAFGDIQLTPTGFLLDKQGNIVKRYLGNYDKDEFVKTVQRALAG